MEFGFYQRFARNALDSGAPTAVVLRRSEKKSWE